MWRRNRDETLGVVAYHQVVRSPHRKIEMINRQEAEKPPRCWIAFDDLVD
jgi:hypothetical protein